MVLRFEADTNQRAGVAQTLNQGGNLHETTGSYYESWLWIPAAPVYNQIIPPYIWVKSQATNAWLRPQAGQNVAFVSKIMLQSEFNFD